VRRQRATVTRKSTSNVVKKSPLGCDEGISGQRNVPTALGGGHGRPKRVLAGSSRICCWTKQWFLALSFALPAAFCPCVDLLSRPAPHFLAQGRDRPDTVCQQNYRKSGAKLLPFGRAGVCVSADLKEFASPADCASPCATALSSVLRLCRARHQ